MGQAAMYGGLNILQEAVLSRTILLAVDSLLPGTLFRDRVGPDIAFIDRALAQTFSHAKTVARSQASPMEPPTRSVLASLMASIYPRRCFLTGIHGTCQAGGNPPVHFSWQVGHGATDRSMQSSLYRNCKGRVRRAVPGVQRAPYGSRRDRS